MSVDLSAEQKPRVVGDLIFVVDGEKAELLAMAKMGAEGSFSYRNCDFHYGSP